MNEAPRHRPRKRFGQNFLHDPQVIARIIAALHPQPGQTWVEIGPGLGALTVPLLQAVGALDVVELDRDLIEPLRSRCAGLGELRIHQADALQFDFTRLCKHGTQLRVVGNLPYNISTPLLFHLLAQAAPIHDLHFMLQREVVERLAAVPNSSAYGRLSVMAKYHCAVQALFEVGPGAFRPAPKVWSAVVRLLPHPTVGAGINNEQHFAEVVKRAFAQRRKTLRNSLQGVLDSEAIKAAGIDPSRRPETLDLAEFAALSNLRSV